MPIDSRRIAKNTLMLYIRMLLLMVVSLYTSRVILSTLGVEDYGIYNLIGGFITLFSFISSSLVGAMQRYFNVCLGKNDKEGYQRVYSMGINIFVLFSIFLMLVGETAGLWFVTTQLNIPEGRETAALWVYQVSLVTMIVTLFRTPSNASIIAHEKMEFYASISIIEAVLKLAIVFLLGRLPMDKLILYVLLYLGTTILINVIYVFYCRKIPECRYTLLWDKHLFRSLISFSGWNMLSGGTRVLKSQGDAFFLNHFYSVAVNAAFGVASQVYNAVNLFLTNFQTAFKPQLVQTYAAGEMDAHHKLINRSAKMSYYLLLLIVVPVIFNLDGLLGLWLEEVPQHTREFCLYVLMAYLVDALGAPLSVSVNASGNIRGLQISTTVMLLLGLGAGFFFLRSGSAPYIISVIIFVVHGGFFVADVYFARKNSNVSVRQFAKSVMLPVALLTIVAVAIPFALTFFYVSKWMVLLVCVIDALWVGTCILFIGMDKNDRIIVISPMKSFIKSIGK